MYHTNGSCVSKIEFYNCLVDFKCVKKYEIFLIFYYYAKIELKIEEIR